QRLPHGVVNRQGGVVGQLHQRQFGRALDRTAAGGDRRGADQGRVRRGLGDAELRGRTQLFLDAQRAGGLVPFGEDARDHAVGVFVFLPGAHVLPDEGDLLQRALALERRRDENRI